MTLLYLIRHARSVWNAEGRWQGQADPPLDDLGVRQAQALAEALREEAFTAVYSSPLARARQTAEPLALACGAPLRLDDRLQERNVGQWAGLTMDEVKARFPGQFHAHWHLEGAPGGEGQADLTRRAAAAVEGIVAAHPDENVAVVSHGGTLNAALAHLLAIPATRLILFRFENTSIARLRVTPERLDLISLGDTRHLDGFEDLIT